MAKNPWFRLYAEFATDPKVQSMSEEMQRRLVMLFCLQCSGDLQKLSDSEIAYFLRVDIETLHETLQLFQDKKFIDENRQICNWNKRQFKSDISTHRVQKHRNKQKVSKSGKLVAIVEKTLPKTCNVSETPPDTDTEYKKKKRKKEKVLAISEAKTQSSVCSCGQHRGIGSWTPEKRAMSYDRARSLGQILNAQQELYLESWEQQHGTIGMQEMKLIA
jgi:hypothetical protein